MHISSARIIRKHIFPLDQHKAILEWLIVNIQENYHKDGSKYTGSATSMYIEYRSKDKLSWIMRLAGNPPSCSVEIKDEKLEFLFLLRWK